ncbi:MarR family transcriptional regulator [Thermosyntropha sp.]|uniref:MarR family winged helix-turn-helix transcriptional regulator n=1 Tax=Thermosyntropha sp. TaxID=2740820 RepID=UPI0025DC0507|nr:MarR family transcriptional regulator [Thermosyntropha sp.]MBO8159090.1 MarR family transcriptional regulator [Thermosyntropha sp.]
MNDFSNYICFNMRAAMKKIDKHLTEKLESYGISIPQSFILSCLLQENGLTLKEIGNRTLIDSSSMTVLVDKLEKEELVERQLDSQDRRAIRVFITDKGRDIAEKIVKLADEFNSHLFEILGEDNQKEFLHGLNNIINGLE